MMKTRESVVTRYGKKVVKNSPDDVAKIASTSREAQLGKEKVFQLNQVTMTSDGIRVAHIGRCCREPIAISRKCWLQDSRQHSWALVRSAKLEPRDYKGASRQR